MKIKTFLTILDLPFISTKNENERQPTRCALLFSKEPSSGKDHCECRISGGGGYGGGGCGGEAGCGKWLETTGR